MFDLKAIRENPDDFDAGWEKRGVGPMSPVILELDAGHRAVLTALQEAQARRNEASKAIGVAKSKGESAAQLMEEVSRLKTEIPELEDEARRYATKLHDVLSGLPNIPADDVPLGADDDDNVELYQVGDIPVFDFTPKQHFELGEALGQMDFESAARMSGARFVVLSGKLARLERALSTFMLDLHTGEFGYREVSPPLLVRNEALFGTGQLPKFTEDLFRTTTDHWLIPTAEVPLTNLVREQILADSDLPLRFTALTPCFRSEAGSAGKDTRGMIRQHQFMKVELVSITRPEESDNEMKHLTGCAEEVLKRLKLPYRVVRLCAGDMGFSARRTFDIEVWLPGQDRYREISSCSSFGDFQARRMNSRSRPTGEKQTRFVHTLNGSGLAVGRTLVAVMENYQQADGSITIPEVLRPYMDNMGVIGVDG